MTLRHLQIYKKVCQMEGITAAAEVLNMSQPAVSIAIKELEDFYGARLFDRMNRRIYLTEEGKRLLHYTDGILSQFQESIEKVKGESGKVSCRLGVNVTVGETRLNKVLKRVKEDVPGCQMTIQIGNSKRMMELLEANEIDLAVIDQPSNDKKWMAVPVYQEKMLLVGSERLSLKKKLRVTEVAQLPLLLRESGSGSRQGIQEIFLQHGCVPTPMVESVSTDCLLRLSREGMGLVFLPESLAKEELKKGGLTELQIIDDEFLRQFFLLYHKEKFFSKEEEAVKTSVIQAF